MGTNKSIGKTESSSILRKVRLAILEGGYADISKAQKELTILMSERVADKDYSLAPLIRTIIAIGDILASDRKFLNEAVVAYGDAAQLSNDHDNDGRQKALVRVLDNAESLPSITDRIAAYRLVLHLSPKAGNISASARQKLEEQDNPSYFAFRPPQQLPSFDESIVENDLVASLGSKIHSVVRQQNPSGEIQYSIIVSRVFSRSDLAHAGIQNTEKLRRLSANNDLDRIVIPASRLPQQTQIDIDFIHRLWKAGIFINAIHGRIRNDAGNIAVYKVSEGPSAEKLRYMGIDIHGITPVSGKYHVPVERIQFHADPCFIGRLSWLQTKAGNMRARVPNYERFSIISSLESHGITPIGNYLGPDYNGYIVIPRESRGILSAVISQFSLHERGENLLRFAETIPLFASSIAVSAYKDACLSFFGTSHRR